MPTAISRINTTLPQHMSACSGTFSNGPGFNSVCCPQVTVPMVAVIRHMHVTARRAVLDAMLRLGPDSSEISAYIPIFSMTLPEHRLHKLLRVTVPAQQLVHAMALIATNAVPSAKAPESLRERIYLLLSDPSSSLCARAVSGIILAGISASTAAYCYETMPGVPGSPAEAARLQVVEVTMVVLFTVEYVARLVCCPQLRAFLASPMNAIDVLSVLPYYISLLSEQLLGGVFPPLHEVPACDCRNSHSSRFAPGCITVDRRSSELPFSACQIATLPASLRPAHAWSNWCVVRLIFVVP